MIMRTVSPAPRGPDQCVGMFLAVEKGLKGEGGNGDTGRERRS